MCSDHAPITVVVASDSFLIGDGLVSLLAGVPDVEVVGRAQNVGELEPLVAALNPRAVIISVRSQVATADLTVSAARRLWSAHPDLGIVVISDRANELALEMLGAGSSGIAIFMDERLPGIDALTGALRDLDTGQTGLDSSFVDMLIRRGDVDGIEELTTREIHVLELVALDLSHRAIAGQLHISVKSVEQGGARIPGRLRPFSFAGSDRRVAAALVYLRTQPGPLGTVVNSGTRTAPVVFLKETEDVNPSFPG